MARRPIARLIGALIVATLFAALVSCNGGTTEANANGGTFSASSGTANAAGTPGAKGSGGGAGNGGVTTVHGSTPGPVSPPSAVVAGFPGYFSFGVSNGAGGAPYLVSMRTTNGTAWDFRYEYLSGGVGTSGGWDSWATPPGQYITNAINENRADGFRSEFVYYTLLQTPGPGTNSDERSTDLAHLADPATMATYFGDWRLVMQRIGAAGVPVVVIVEPDLWGYIEQTAVRNGTNSAASIPASVGSSGFADVQGYPNTAQGFAWALLHIRDLYAKNAVLALHASPWGTLHDIGSDTNPNTDAVALGKQEAQFLLTCGLAGNPAGVSTFDLLSEDIANHDSGQNGVWWDPNNQGLPNFARFLSYAHEMVKDTGKRLLLWQVPLGNQYFDTENNSPGHTQDNKAQYILSHVADFANAGIIGVQFGTPLGGTNIFDTQRDGVTNPAPISTFQCNLCNNHVSQYPDDDGGYLRIFVGQYYRNGPVALPATVP